MVLSGLDHDNDCSVKRDVVVEQRLSSTPGMSSPGFGGNPRPFPSANGIGMTPLEPCALFRRLSIEDWNKLGKAYPIPGIRNLRPMDAEFIGTNLRESDIQELAAARPGRDPVTAVVQAVRDSRMVWVGVLAAEGSTTKSQAGDHETQQQPPDIPTAVFGLADHPLREDTGVPWMLAAPGFELKRIPAARLSRQVVQAMRTYYPGLENYVHARHSTAIRWLSFCGFKIHPAPVPAPLTKEPFLRFTIP